MFCYYLPDTECSFDQCSSEKPLREQLFIMLNEDYHKMSIDPRVHLIWLS